ncbi:NlpC/P60 family protein [Kibdelosporangium lantanae]|uniref:NlpC/P60 family protein n=1 Tax=Kibdelosporangium lantanae TaxID=1497396 RepID=A0ABW3M3H5_9PSEU
MAKLGIAAVAAIVLIPIILAAMATALVSTLLSSNPSNPSQAALDDIPRDYLDLYRSAAQVCPGLDWSILAAIGKVETDHGRSNLPGVHSGENYAHAAGPMQFLASTFNAVVTRHPLPPGGSTPPSRYNPHDAIYAAAYYLCDSGARDNRDLHGAIFAYNHAEWYVKKVLDQAAVYAQALGDGNCITTLPTSHPALVAITYACKQLGQPYVWGGDGPEEGGFDCSGLVKASYAAAGIGLPRTADSQFRLGHHLESGTTLDPGDLVFYGNPVTKIHHVGLYIGNGRMIHAPDKGKPVQIGNYRYRGDDYAGATRPWR